MGKEQCKARKRRTSVFTLPDQCARPAVRDGYCTRHHPDYVSPSMARHFAALAPQDGETGR